MQNTKDVCLNDNCYNIIHQLSKTLGFLARADQYVEDAKKAGDAEAEKVWNIVRTDRKKHAELLRSLVKNEITNNKF